MVSVLAILCVRNESVHIGPCIEDLVADGIEVHVIDHSSTDDTREIAESYVDRGVLTIDTMAWEGAFSLSAQMREKARVAATATHDWLVHIDADERLQSPVDDETLGDAIRQADDAGSTCINFEEFVFVPEPGSTQASPTYRSEMTDYYFFEPSKQRLMRAFKRSDDLVAWQQAGHRVTQANQVLHPTNFILRHYLALSARDFKEVYRARTFATEDLEKGWHGNRLAIASYAMPDRQEHGWIKSLASPASRDFDRSNPAGTHFWQWGD